MSLRLLFILDRIVQQEVPLFYRFFSACQLCVTSKLWTFKPIRIHTVESIFSNVLKWIVGLVLEIRVQKVALKWQSEFVKCAGREMLPFLSNMLQAILPCLSLTGELHKELVELATSVNLDLQDLITEADDERPTGSAAPLRINTNMSSTAAESLTSVSSTSNEEQDNFEQWGLIFICSSFLMEARVAVWQTRKNTWIKFLI